MNETKPETMTPQQMNDLWEKLCDCYGDIGDICNLLDEARKGKFGDIKTIEELDRVLEKIEGCCGDIEDAQNALSSAIDELEDMADDEEELQKESAK